MLAIAARRMGYRVHTLSPERDSPTGQVADAEVTAPWDDLDAVRAFARGVDVVTFEFENVPVATAEAAAALVPVRPSGTVLHTTQQRLREKGFLAGAGFPVPSFVAVRSADDVRAGLARLGLPAMLKSAAFGYDGKGQTRIDRPEEAGSAWDAAGGREAILEAFVDFEQELSVVAARGPDGGVVDYGVLANSHSNHILDVTLAPAPVPTRVALEAVDLARAILERLDVVGVACVELFLDRAGRLLVNEIAPRPHNSGHLTVDASVTSQFEQQLRAVCGLPLGSPELLRPAAMANLLGDLWANGEPDWAAACAFPEVKVHLYGKREARSARKMGHLTALAPAAEEARTRVVAAREALARRPR
jgi:5-(carboxyamino)imidazole ribonucleotide synthase